MPGQRPYAALHAKGEGRRQLIIAVAHRLLGRNGWRNTTLSQIAREAGLTPAGLLHHFESKDHLLDAVLQDQDTYDDINADLDGDLAEELRKVPERFRRMPDLVGTYVVLGIENVDPRSPQHDRVINRYHAALEMLAGSIRKGQEKGRYRTDIDPFVKAVEILAFVNGMETSWLLDPSIPLTEVFQEYADSFSRQLKPHQNPASGTR